MNTIWLIKLILSHLLTDFFLQRSSWIEDRKKRHFKSGYLYLHTIITASVVQIFVGYQYWPISLIIFVSHTLIDGWKSYQPAKPVYFVIDQSLHFIVILLCWVFTFVDIGRVEDFFTNIDSNKNFWIITTALLSVTLPTGILVGELTRKWRSKLEDIETLANAGKWIGIIERILVLILVLESQFEAIGLLVAAKTIIRFNENNRTEQKTEYLLIGTLISIGIAVVVGLIVRKVIS